MRRLLRRYRWHLELGLVFAVVAALVWVVYPRIQDRIERDRQTRWENARLLIHQGDLDGLRTYLDTYSLEWLEPDGSKQEHGLIVSAAGQRDIEMVQELLQRGANVNGKGSYFKSTPILSAITTHDPQYRADKADEMVAFLLDNGADPNAYNHVYAAVVYGEHDALRVLLERGADPDLVDSIAPRSAVNLARQGECAICLELLGDPTVESTRNPHIGVRDVKGLDTSSPF